MSTIIRKQVSAFNWIEVDDFSKIINRKKYDTATAELLMWKYIDNAQSEFSEWGYHKAVFLFQKKNGEFFSYAVGFDSLHIDNFLLITKRLLVPLSEEEAKDFVEKYGDGEIFEEIFGEVEE